MSVHSSLTPFKKAKLSRAEKELKEKAKEDRIQRELDTARELRLARESVKAAKDMLSRLNSQVLDQISEEQEFQISQEQEFKESQKQESTEPNEVDTSEFDLEFSNKKKKKKKVIVEPIKESNQEDDYSYADMLGFIYSHLNKITTLRKVKIPEPQTTFLGSKRTIWSNFSKCREAIHRPTQHVLDFIRNEIGADASVTENGSMIIKARLVGKQIESLLRQYIKKYASCISCNSIDTNLVKDPIVRLYFKECNVCHTKSAVDPILRAATTGLDLRKTRKGAKNAV